MISRFLFAPLWVWQTLAMASDMRPLPVEPTVMDTPIRAYIDQLKKDLDSSKRVPQTLEEGAFQIADVSRSPFKEDIDSAAAKSAEVACGKTGRSFSGRIQAAIFTETFWKSLEHGKISHLIQGAKLEADTNLLFAEFLEKYLNEFAIAWAMRERDNRLYLACKSYGIDGVTPCLQVLLVLGASRPTKCHIALVDEMFIYLPEPQPDNKVH